MTKTALLRVVPFAIIFGASAYAGYQSRKLDKICADIDRSLAQPLMLPENPLAEELKHWTITSNE